MKLVIQRRQQAKKGMLGGHKGVEFTLDYRLVLTEEEASLVQEYKLDGYPLTWNTVEGSRFPDDTIGRMVDGRSESLSDVTTLVNNEDVVKDACDQLPILFEVVRSFGGEEVISYPRVK